MTINMSDYPYEGHLERNRPIHGILDAVLSDSEATVYHLMKFTCD